MGKQRNLCTNVAAANVYYFPSGNSYKYDSSLSQEYFIVYLLTLNLIWIYTVWYLIYFLSNEAHC